MNSPKAMPKGPAPFSRADIEIVKKISAPTANGSSHGSKAFSVPKAVPKGGNNNRLQHKRYEDDDEDDDEGKRSVISDEEKHGNKDDEDDIDDDSDHFVVREKLSSERSVKHTVTSTSSYKLPPAEDNVRKDSSNNNNEGESSLESSNPPSPAGEVVFNFRPLLKATYRVLRDFVLSPAAKGVITRCYIERTLKAAEFFVPRYSLCADLEDGTGRELIVCRKIMTSRTPHYGE